TAHHQWVARTSGGTPSARMSRPVYSWIFGRWRAAAIIAPSGRTPSISRSLVSPGPKKRPASSSRVPSPPPGVRGRGEGARNSPLYPHPNPLPHEGEGAAMARRVGLSPRSYPRIRVSGMLKNWQVAQKGPAARRRPTGAREAYSLYVERKAVGANDRDEP